MKILTNLHDKNKLDDLLKVADGIILGDAKYAKTLTSDFGSDTINLIEKIYEAKKEVFVLLNRVFTDKELDSIKPYILSLPVDKITGFMGADLGLIDTFKTLNIEHKFIYNPETLLTNDEDFNDLSSEGIMGAFVSKEITLEDILEIGQLKKYKMFYFGHGHMSMFYSKRPMLKTFNDHRGLDNYLHDDKTLTLTEERRLNEAYPVLEDDAGTHVFRGTVFNSFKVIEPLKTVVDYFIVDTLFMDDDYAYKLIPMYKNNDFDLQLITDYKQTLHDGFLFDESTIKGEKND
ncbi:U32 family peptidase [Acholeplasma laidlawii]|uniref:Peptidase U32 family protein n=2 Tax=Acholeplasma laidlawii TaxID=2148 RepID=A9NF36_ACHLI|nr:U32 family peptidase [Acholeplasma laidlawii]ABX80966.1 peptidase U32 family protein [Acholeplasma laidlawii PG-8A]NWH10468.1 U32 family peptidase [Acholeplasma laidlawii]NWH11856.1 U32 family peptidase [Acholeplasma laidlawii]NWH12736.1 U32 family peptidase [Acholeplasma laidlawii]NWH13885.1 U32 family peptidase [Acholeplasma laidlawii]